MQFSKDLIARLRKNEETACTELYRKAGTMLYNFILCRVGRDEEAAGDVLSEVFLDVVKYSGSLTPMHNLNAWLFRITRSKIANHFRKLNRDKKFQSSALVESIEDNKGQGLDPELQLIDKFEKDFVKEAFTALSAEYREIMERKYVLGQSMKKIAEDLKRSGKSVESILYRARKQLERSLAKLRKKHERKGMPDG